MGLPKKPKYSIDINPPIIGHELLKYGDERIKKILNDTDPRTKYIPSSILLEDLDQAMFDVINDGELSITIDNEKVPVIFMDNERWGEFSKTWTIADDDKNVKTPYITVRRTEKKKGTRIGEKYHIPQLMKHTYINVPYYDEGETIYLSFKVPEPTNIDLTYDIQLFTKYRIDVNLFDETFFYKFASKQIYCSPKNNPMPIKLISSEEPQNIENVDGDKFYISKHNVVLTGFMLKEEDIEVIKTKRKPIFGVFLT